MLDAIRSFASGLFFTTNCSRRGVVAGALTSATLKTEEGVCLRAQHQERSQKLKQMLAERAHLPVEWSESHVVPLMVPGPCAV